MVTVRMMNTRQASPGSLAEGGTRSVLASATQPRRHATSSAIPATYRDDTGNQEGGPPGEVVDHHPDEHRRQRVAGIAEDAVDAEAHPLLARRSDDPGDPDRMVDGGEQADQGQPGEDHVGAVGETGDDGAGADAQEEDHDHADLAPAVAEPAGREGRNPVQHEPEAGEGQQLAVGEIEHLRQVEHGGGVEHREHVRAGVPEVGERDRGAISGPRLSGRGVHCDLRRRSSPSSGIEADPLLSGRGTHCGCPGACAGAAAPLRGAVRPVRAARFGSRTPVMRVCVVGRPATSSSALRSSDRATRPR